MCIRDRRGRPSRLPPWSFWMFGLASGLTLELTSPGRNPSVRQGRCMRSLLALAVNNELSYLVLRAGKLAFGSCHDAPLAPVSDTHLRAHETVLDLVCRLLLEKKRPYSIYYAGFCFQHTFLYKLTRQTCILLQSMYRDRDFSPTS